ncbi:MAG TPA: hypothetical protein VN802_14260 [Stellaceae bacterium]|nr:hypothetical protein [Stellaceae bacterium]
MTPTAEDAARRILRLFVGHFHAGPGRVLKQAILLRDFSSDEWQAAAYEAGVMFATEHGWLAAASDTLTLTSGGYAAAVA